MPGTSPHTDASPRVTFGSPQWWIRDRDGHVAIAQAPNAAILVWLATVLAGWSGIVDDHREGVLTRVGQGALIVWGLDELLRGTSPLRRLLGLVVLAVLLVRVLG